MVGGAWGWVAPGGVGEVCDWLARRCGWTYEVRGVGGAYLGGRGLWWSWCWSGAMGGTYAGAAYLHIICIQVCRWFSFLGLLVHVDLHAHLHTHSCAGFFCTHCRTRAPPEPPRPHSSGPAPRRGSAHCECQPSLDDAYREGRGLVKPRPPTHTAFLLPQERYRPRPRSAPYILLVALLRVSLLSVSRDMTNWVT